MKLIYHIIISFILVYGSLLAQTNKSGDIDGETWTVDGAPYIIIDNIKVIDLTIEPGVLVQFGDNYKFEVDGTLQAKGFHSDSIYFQPQPGNGAGWEGIKFKNTAYSSSLNYCRIEGANKDGINIDVVQPEISNCRIINSTENGIFLKNTTIQIYHCIIANNTLNGIETDNVHLTILNSIISDNGESGILSIHNDDVFELTNIVIADNQDRGVDCPNGILTIRNSILYNNTIQVDSQDGNTEITYSDIQGEPVFQGEGNINTEPEFSNRSTYTLYPQSPCIDAGDQNFAYTDRFFPPSLGSSRNDMGAYGGPQAFGWYPPVYIKPQIYNFNRVTQDSSQSTSLNILNYRDTDITVSDISFEGNEPDVFSGELEDNLIAISDSVEMTVTFEPENEEIYNSDLIFHTESHGTVSMPLSGEGVLAHMNMSTSDLNFGAVNLGEKKDLNIPISNLGGDTLFIQITPPSTSIFTVDKTQITVNPDLSTETLVVTFTPESPQNYQDSIIVISNDRDRPEQTIYLNGLGLGSEIVIDQQQIDYDSVTVLSDSIQFLSINNTGNDTLLLYNLTITPSNAGFTLDDAPFIFPLLIAPNSSMNLAITFSPLERGELSAQLTITSNDPYQDMLTVDLTGFGLAPLLKTSSSEIQFNTVPLTSDSTINLTVFNLGNDILQLDSLLISPADDVFKMSDTTLSFPYSLKPESNIAFPIRFTPVERGITRAQIALPSNDPFQDTVFIDLSGEGVAAGLNLSAYALNFGSVQINSDSIKNLILYNTIETGLTLDSIVMDPVTSVFEITDSTLVFPHVIDPKDSLGLSVRFQPTEIDSANAEIRIFSDDPFQKEVQVKLSGRGIDTSPKPYIVLSSTFLEFNEVDTNSYSQKNLYIYNIGNADLIIPKDSIFIADSPNNAFSIMNISDEIRVRPQDSLEIIIRFEPFALGPIENLLLIRSNDPLNPKMEVTLSGTGITPTLIPEIKLSTDILEFNQVDTSSFAQRTLTIYNIGAAELLIPEDSIYLSETSHHAFSLINVFGDISIDPLDSLGIFIDFNPKEIGLLLDTLHIHSNDPQMPEIMVSLSGVGVDSGSVPELKLSTDALEYNLVDTSMYVDQSLHISNIGSKTLLIPVDSIYIAGSAYDAFSIMNISDDISLLPQDSQEVVIRFEPPEPGPDQATLWIKSNDPINPTHYVLLSGTGVGNGSATISFDPTNSTDPLINKQPATMSFTITSLIAIDSAKIFIRKGGETSFNTYSLQKQIGTIVWSTEIESGHVTERGVEYYVKVYQGQTVSPYPQNGESHPIAASVQIPYIAFPERTPAKTYQMISLPFNTSGQTLGDLFADNLGPYNNNKYRIFECINGSDYSELIEMNKQLPPGKSVWLITKDEHELDIQNGASILTDEDFEIELKQGWNMISTPFSFPVSWEGLGSGIALRHFDGSDWPFATIMEPFKGYAVKASKDTVIFVSPNETTLAKSLPGSILPESEDNWNIQISATSKNLSDRYNYIGTVSSANHGKDRFDHPEPPPIGEYLSVYLLSRENNEHLSTDYRQPDADGYIFDIEMRSNVTGQKIIQLFENNLPEKYDWKVIAAETKLDLGKKTITTSQQRIKYKLIVGSTEFLSENTSDYLSVPADFKLTQNYPNPFNPSTTIKYQLPISSQVDIRVFDILGQEVVHLLSEKQEPGYYEIEWRGTNQANQFVSSGIYILQIRSRDFNRAIKMILQR